VAELFKGVGLRPFDCWDRFSNPAAGVDVRPFRSLCVVWVAAAVRYCSLVQRSHTGSVCIVCDLETSTVRRLRPELGCCGKEKKKKSTQREIKRIKPVTT
jgi:hypothetical protein